MKKQVFIGCAAALLLAVSSVHAGLIYDNGAPDASNGNEMTNWIQAEDFTLGAAATVTDVRFWAIGIQEPGSYQGSITWSLYADAAGQPGGLLYRNLVTPSRMFDHAVDFGSSYQYDFSVGSLNLAAGTYWLGLHNGPLSTTDRLDLYWETTAGNLTATGSEDEASFDDGSWYNNEPGACVPIVRQRRPGGSGSGRHPSGQPRHRPGHLAASAQNALTGRLAKITSMGPQGSLAVPFLLIRCPPDPFCVVAIHPLSRPPRDREHVA